MKILYINAMEAREKTPHGGIFITQRIQALRSLKVDVYPVIYSIEYDKFAHFIMKKIGKPLPDQGAVLKKQLNVYYDIRKIQYSLFSGIIARINPGIYQKRVAKKIKKDINCYKNIDLIHLHWLWPVGLGVKKISKLMNIPYVITCHGSDINVLMRKKQLRKYIIDILENAAAVEFVSSALMETAKKLGYSGKNAYVVYNGIDTDIFSTDLLIEREKRIGFVGNLIEIKGADRLPELFKQIYQLSGQNCKFTVVGAGYLQDELKEKMETLPVNFTGRLEPEDLKKEYEKMNVIVVPSRNEGYPCVIREAQACGVIPVGNKVGGISEAISSYGSAIEAKNENELIEKMARQTVEYLKNGFDDRQKMIFESKKCSWIETQKKSLEIYNAILDDQ